MIVYITPEKHSQLVQSRVFEQNRLEGIFCFASVWQDASRARFCNSDFGFPGDSKGITEKFFSRMVSKDVCVEVLLAFLEKKGISSTTLDIVHQIYVGSPRFGTEYTAPFIGECTRHTVTLGDVHPLIYAVLKINDRYARDMLEEIYPNCKIEEVDEDRQHVTFSASIYRYSITNSSAWMSMFEKIGIEKELWSKISVEHRPFPETFPKAVPYRRVGITFKTENVHVLHTALVISIKMGNFESTFKNIFGTECKTPSTDRSSTKVLVTFCVREDERDYEDLGRWQYFFRKQGVFIKDLSFAY